MEVVFFTRDVALVMLPTAHAPLHDVDVTWHELEARELRAVALHVLLDDVRLVGRDRFALDGVGK